MNIAIATAAYLWAFWAVYVLVMGIYRAHLAKRLGPVTFCLSLPFVALGLAMDAFANLTFAALLFWERPREWLVTARLQRYVAQGSGWRFTIANWICNNLLDVPRSNSQKSIAGASSTEVPAWNFTLSMAAGDYFELMWAVDNTEVFLNSDAAPAFGPSVPSVILSVAKINQ